MAAVGEILFFGDTIINLKGFIDSTKGGLRAYRLIFGREENIDSAWQVDKKFRVTDKVFNLGRICCGSLPMTQHSG